MSKTEWGGQGVRKKDTGRRIERYGVSLVANEVAIDIVYYERIDYNGEEVEYNVARKDTHPVVKYNTFLIHSGFEMHRMVGASNPINQNRLPCRIDSEYEYQNVLGEYSYP